MNKISKLLLAAVIGFGWAAIVSAEQAETCYRFCDAAAANAEADACWRWCSTAGTAGASATPCTTDTVSTDVAPAREEVIHQDHDRIRSDQAATKPVSISHRVAFDIED